MKKQITITIDTEKQAEAKKRWYQKHRQNYKNITVKSGVYDRIKEISIQTNKPISRVVDDAITTLEVD